MDLKQIKQLIDLMTRSDLTEFEVEEEGFKLKIRRGSNGQPMIASAQSSGIPFSAAGEGIPVMTAVPIPIATPVASAAAPANTLAPATPANDEAGIIYIKSPMVGTFYASPSPESKPFAEKGTKVAENTVVCIIEAMKIMNEIQAELKGTILEILVESGQPVEYGQRLFKVKQG